MRVKNKLCTFLLVSLPSLFITSAFATDITVVTAAGYKKPMNEVYTAFTEATGIGIESAFGNIKQIEAQANQNPDVQMIIGDWDFIKPMGFSEKNQQLGQGKLILVAPKNSTLTKIEDLKTEKIQKIAIGNRKNTIYGKAAIECLTDHKLLDEVEAKLMQVSTLPQVSTYVLTNEVDVGFVNLSEAMAHMDRFTTPIELPQSCYRPIDLSIVSIDGRESVEGTVLLDFLASDETKEILKRHGLHF